MDLYYYKDSFGNFGDDLNEWLWPKLLDKPIDQCFDENTMFIGIGTILNDKVPEEPRRKIVFGSGTGYGNPPSITEDWSFYGVRGPLTASRLGLSQELVISDGAILLGALMPPADRPRHQVAFMPHHKSAQWGDWKNICESIGIQYIDPMGEVESVIDLIRYSSVLITEAMHGAIVADVLRVPWVPVCTSNHILQFKWRDWTSSLGMTHEFQYLPSIWRAKGSEGTLRRFRSSLKRVAVVRKLTSLGKRGRRYLSEEKRHAEMFSKASARLDKLQQDA